MYYKITTSLTKEKCIEIIEEKTYETFTNSSFVNVYKNIMRIIITNEIILLGKFSVILPMSCMFYCKVKNNENNTVIEGIIGMNPITVMVIMGLLIGLVIDVLFYNFDTISFIGTLALILFGYIPYYFQKKEVKNIPQEICELIDGRLEIK